MRRSRFLIGMMLLMALLAIGAVACGDSDDADADPTATADQGEATATAVPDGNGAADEATAPPEFEGSRDPVEIPGDGSGAQLVDVRAARDEGFDRVVFEFEGAQPGANVAYVSPPVTACGSGMPVDVAGGALLQVRMSPAAAHDDAGTTTFDLQELNPGLPTILVVVQTCDFEGELTWVVGLTSEVDFVTMTLPDPFRIVIDAAHP